MPQFLQTMLLIVTVVVIFVNGWTDAPNAIASAVSTGAMGFRPAVRLAAVCNLLGLVAIGMVNASVVDTMTSMARFDGGSPGQSMAALCAAMISIVLFAVVAWAFGIPTSESHALIAGLTGSALALGGRGNIDFAAWSKVLWGLAISLFAGLALGWMLTTLLDTLLRRLPGNALGRFQIAAAGGMAFMHGAQDGQKFVAVLVTVALLSKNGGYSPGSLNLREHWLALLFCGAVMALGTSVGGRRIVETVGQKMVTLGREQGVCADLAGILCLLVASLTGIPMSTTHTKTTAMMGAGLAGRKGRNGRPKEGRGALDLRVVGGMVLAWGITFPVCGLLSYGLTRLFLALL